MIILIDDFEVEVCILYVFENEVYVRKDEVVGI